MKTFREKQRDKNMVFSGIIIHTQAIKNKLFLKDKKDFSTIHSLYSTN